MIDPLLIGKSLDLVDFGDVALLMLRDDNLYQLSVPAERKNRSLREHYLEIARHGHKKSPVTPQTVAHARQARDCFAIVLDHLWRHKIGFTVLDIGAFIGDFSIKMANIMRTFGRDEKVYAFDPTEAGALIPYNVELNGLEGRVLHERLAVLDYDGLAVFEVRPGYADASFARGANKGSHRFNWAHLLGHLARTKHKGAYLDKAKRYLKRPETHSLIVDGITIPTWLKRRAIEGALLAKIDVEGADRAILEQLLALPGRHVVSCVEFTPNSYASAREAADFLVSLTKKHHVFDLWYSPNPCRCAPVEGKDARLFVEDVQEKRVFGYTDLLLVPKDLPGAEVLAKRLAALERAPEEYLLA